MPVKKKLIWKVGSCEPALRHRNLAVNKTDSLSNICSVVGYSVALLLLIITRGTLGPTRWTGSHKQAARGPGDAPSNSLASPYQIVFMASSIVQTMDWWDWYGSRPLKPDFIHFQLRIAWPWYLVRSVIDPDEIPAQRTCHTNTSWYCGGWEGETCSKAECEPRGLKSSSTVVLLVEKPFMRLQTGTTDSNLGRCLIILTAPPGPNQAFRSLYINCA